MIARVPYLVLALFLVPIASGLAFTFLPALGLDPSTIKKAAVHQDASHSMLHVVETLLAWPGLWSALRSSLISGLGATLIAGFLAFSITACLIKGSWFQRVMRLQLPLLALPHAALAVGLAFLLAPSGWALRLISPLLTGFSRPPDFLFPADPYGLALMLGLIIKELPFLLLVIMAALNQVPYQAKLSMASTLGYGRITAFWICVFPQIYKQIRLPLFAVLAYSLSVVDMALILGPGNPATLAVQVLTWFHDPDLSLRPLACAGACLILLLILGTMGLWFLAEKALRPLTLSWATSGQPYRLAWISRITTLLGLGLSFVLASFALTTLLLWSFAWRWRFPDALPKSWSFKTWGKAFDQLWLPLANGLSFALASAFVAMVLALLCLELEQRRGRRMSKAGLLVLYLPLLVPQISFLFGVKILVARFYWDGLWLTLLWSHLLFVLPYFLLAMSEPFHSLDPRFAQIGRTLGRGPWQVFWRIKLPLLKPALLFSFALGFAVSFTQYLPTLMLGAGRFPTLTTEAVSLAAGGDRRILSVYALLQALVPLLLFLGASLMAHRQNKARLKDVFKKTGL